MTIIPFEIRCVSCGKKTKTHGSCQDCLDFFDAQWRIVDENGKRLIPEGDHYRVGEDAT